MLMEARDKGHVTLTVRAGYLQSRVGVTSRAPMACIAMYKMALLTGGCLIYSPPGGMGLRLTIEYDLSRLPPAPPDYKSCLRSIVLTSSFQMK